MLRHHLMVIAQKRQENFFNFIKKNCANAAIVDLHPPEITPLEKGIISKELNKKLEIFFSGKCHNYFAS